jgi:hypothetical protein
MTACAPRPREAEHVILQRLDRGNAPVFLPPSLRKWRGGTQHLSDRTKLENSRLRLVLLNLIGQVAIVLSIFMRAFYPYKNEFLPQRKKYR